MSSVINVQAALQRPNHSKALVVSAVLLLILLSWYYMLFGMSMNMSPVKTWNLADLSMLFLMWAIMMVGMMLPSAYPVIMLVEKLNQRRRQQTSTYTSSLFFVLGYLLVWSAYSLVITVVQYALHYSSLLSPMMVSANLYFSAALLIGAGLYQFTDLKKTCIKHCRSPLSMLTLYWREGISGAIALGLRHGQYCLGCCWVLMSLLFATGVMNLKWIFVLSTLVLLEKVIIKKPLLDKILGWLLMLIGGASLLISYVT